MQSEINISEVISKELIFVDLEVNSKDELIEFMSDKLYVKNVVNDKSLFMTDVYLREGEGETGIGQGIAIPHGKSDAVVQTSIAIATLGNPIDWEALDDEKVDVVIMFAVKNTEANTKHIKLLQQIAILLANENFIEAIREAQSNEELLNVINKF